MTEVRQAASRGPARKGPTGLVEMRAAGRSKREHGIAEPSLWGTSEGPAMRANSAAAVE
jgi:hypothetical protein